MERHSPVQTDARLVLRVRRAVPTFQLLYFPQTTIFKSRTKTLFQKPSLRWNGIDTILLTAQINKSQLVGVFIGSLTSSFKFCQDGLKDRAVAKSLRVIIRAFQELNPTFRRKTFQHTAGVTDSSESGTDLNGSSF